jgi:gluconokinase
VVGWSFGTSAAELWRACLEAIAYRFAAIYDLLKTAIPPPREFVASGAALLHSRVWVQVLADVLGVPVTLSGEAEASARGAALVGLRALGVIPHLNALPAAVGETYLPRAELFEVYARARERQQRLYHLLLDRSS